MKLQGVQLNFSTAYHPQSNGQTEVLNRCLETYLRCMVIDEPKQWPKWLTLAEWWYNTTYHSAIQMSPFEALYGIPPPIHIPYIPHDTNIASIEEWFQLREAKLVSLKANMAKATNIMKQIADKHRSKREFKVGNWVYVKLQPYVQTTLRKHHNQKLGPKYFGPYLILEKVGAVAYRLDLPTDSQLHPTFHVSLLKSAPSQPQEITPIPQLSPKRLMPRAILDRKFTKRVTE